jgi:uncharacterized membrane protein
MKIKSNRKAIRAIFGYFLKGLLLIAPLYLTLSVIASTVNKIDSLVKSSIPGLGLSILLALATLVGYLGSTIILRSLFERIEKIIKKLPLINLLYSSSKDIFEAFVGEKKIFDSPVFVTISKTDEIYRIGFITNNDLTFINMPGMVAVYIPNSYSLSGEVIILPRNAIRSINVPSADVTKFVLSGGITEVSNQYHNKDQL